MRLADIEGLTEETVGQALRARQRRILTARDPEQHLLALAAHDTVIDRSVFALTLPGPAALETIVRVARQLDDSSENRDAAYLELACAAQLRAQDLPQRAAAALAADVDYETVRDALWFYPWRPDTVLTADQVDLEGFLGASDPTLRRLGVELTGRLGQTRWADSVKRHGERDPEFRYAAPLALARLGVTTGREASLLDGWLSDGQPEAIAAALEIALILGLPTLARRALTSLRWAGADNADAWLALNSIYFPDSIWPSVDTAAAVDLGLRCRVAALTGRLDAVIRVCDEMAASDQPASRAQRDVLALALGRVPMETHVRPNDPEAKNVALRALLLQVLRTNHIPVHNDADRAPWTVPAILAEPKRHASLRLRDGRPYSGRLRAFPACIAEVTHPLRQWLYWERAALQQSAIGLSALDVARRQRDALMVAQAVQELDAAQ